MISRMKFEAATGVASEGMMSDLDAFIGVASRKALINMIWRYCQNCHNCQNWKGLQKADLGGVNERKT